MRTKKEIEKEVDRLQELLDIWDSTFETIYAPDYNVVKSRIDVLKWVLEL